MLNWGLVATDSASNPIVYSAIHLPAGLTLAPTTGVISGTIANGDSETGPYSVTVTARDSVNNDSTSQSFQWTIHPTVTLVNPGSRSNGTGDSVNIALSANDSAGNALSYAAINMPSGLMMNTNTGIISGTVNGMAGYGSPYSTTVTVSDALDSTVSASQTFTWTIGTAGTGTVTVTNPGSQTNSEGAIISWGVSASDSNSNPLVYSASNLPWGLAINRTTGVISGTIAAGASSASPRTVTVTATDSVNASLGASQAFQWTIHPSVTLTNPGSHTNANGDTVYLSLSGGDSAGNALSYTALNLPAGLMINSTTGVISGTISGMAAFSSPYSTTVTARDATDWNASASQAFTWTVGSAGTVTVTLTNPGTHTNFENEIFSWGLSATDSASNALTYSAANLPMGLTIDPSTGVISGIVYAMDSLWGPYSVTVTAADAVNSSIRVSQTFQWTIHPNVTSANLGSPINANGDTVRLAVVAWDSAGNPMTFSATGLPNGLGINSTTGIISGTVSSGANISSPYFFTVWVTDSVDSSAYTGQTYQWTINASGTITVTLTNPGAHTNAEGESVQWTVSATDSASNTLLYSAANLPPGITLAPGTGVISGMLTAGASASSPYTVNLTVRDSLNSNVAMSQAFNWTVHPSITFTHTTNQVNADSDNIYLPLSATDSAGNSFNYGALNLPPGLSLNPTTGVISGTVWPTAHTGSPYAVTVTATDTKDGIGHATDTFVWTIGATGTVTVTLINPGNRTNADCANVSLALSGTDSASNALTFGAVGLPSGLTIDTTSGMISGTIAPNTDRNSPYAVTVFANDSINGSIGTSQTFVWTVTYAVAPAFVTDAAYSVLHDHTLTVAAPGILANVTNPNSAPLSAVVVAGPSHGTLTLGSDGSFIYVPNTGFAGTDTFTFAANNGVQNGSSGMVYLFVKNTAPIAAPIHFTTTAGQTLAVGSATGMIPSAYDADGNSLTAQLVAGPSHGSLTLNTDGSFNYVPASGFSGNDTFAYQVSDGIVTSGTAMVTISVTGSAAIATDDQFAVAMDQTLTISGLGVLSNDVAPAGGTLAAILNSGPSHGTLSLSSGGSFTYTPDQGFTGDDSFFYRVGAAIGTASAQVRLNVVSVTLTMDSNWVAINANDDNGSPAAAGSNGWIPSVRDYNYLGVLPNNRLDFELRPLDINISAGEVPVGAGYVMLNLAQSPGATGKISLWLDQRKTARILPGLYPIGGPGALPATIYVEGTNPTSRTIVNNAIQDLPDNTISVTYYQYFTILAMVPVAVGQISVGVGPVVNFFTINNQPNAAPNPVVANPNVGRVYFPNFAAENDFRQGIATRGRLAASSPAAVFDAQMYNATPSRSFDQLQFVQNVSPIANGVPGRPNAFTFAMGASQNWRFLTGARGDANRQIITRPVLDTAGEDPAPATPFANRVWPPPQPPNNPLGYLDQVQGGDKPTWQGLGLINLRGDFQNVTNIDFTIHFTLFLTWQMPAYFGAFGNIIYTLAVREWSAVVAAGKATMDSAFVDQIRPGSGVFSPGEFVTAHYDPVVIGPNANYAQWIT